VQIDGERAYINHSGKSISGKFYDALLRFSDDRAVCGGDGKYGYIDHLGHQAISAKFSKADPFRDGVAKVYVGSIARAIDTSGKFVRMPPYHNDQYQGLITEHLIRSSNGNKYGFKDSSGRFVIKPVYDDVGIFDHGLTPAKVGGKWGVIDKSAKFVIEPKFDDMDESFSENLIAVKSDGRWGVIDSAGIIIVKPEYDQIYPYSNGMSIVQSGIKFGYIDTQGKEVFAPQFDKADQFNADGRARMAMRASPLKELALP